MNNNNKEDERNKILKTLITNPLYYEITEKYTVGNKYLTDELFQEICLIFSQMDTDKLINIYHSKGEKGLRYFFVGITRNQTISNSSDFYKKYKKNNNLITEIDLTQINSPLIKDNKENKKVFDEKIIDRIKNYLIEFERKNLKINWYYKTLFELYFFEGLSYQQIRDETKISYPAIYQGVQKMIKLIKKKIKDGTININNKGNIS